jgi:hypothetical protein
MCEMTELKEKVENAKAQLHLSTQEFSTLKTQLDITKVDAMIRQMLNG